MLSSLYALILNYCQHYRGLSKNCWAGICINFIDSVFVALFYFMMFYLVHDLHFSVATAGVMISCYGIGTIIGAYGGGYLCDYFTPQSISITTLGIQAFAYLLLVTVHSLPGLILLFLFMGIAAYAFITANTTWVMDACRTNDEAEKMKATNILSVIGNLAFGIAIIGIGLGAHFGFHNLFIVSGCTLFAFSLCAWIIQGPKKRSHITPSSITTLTPMLPMHNRTILWITLLSLFLMGTVVAQLGSTYTVYIQQNFPALGLNGPSILLVINAAMVTFLQAPLVNRFHNTNPLHMIGIAAAILGIGMMILSFSHQFAWAIVSCIIYTLGEMLFFSKVQLVCYQRGATGRKGKSLGLYRTIYATARVIAPISGGLIYQHFGGAMIWLVSGGLGGFCMLACIGVEQLSYGKKRGGYDRRKD